MFRHYLNLSQTIKTAKNVKKKNNKKKSSTLHWSYFLSKNLLYIMSSKSIPFFLKQNPNDYIKTITFTTKLEEKNEIICVGIITKLMMFTANNLPKSWKLNTRTLLVLVIFNRPGVVGAVLKTALWLSNLVMVSGNIFKTQSIPNRKS